MEPSREFYYATEFTGFKPNPERSEGTFSKYSSLMIAQMDSIITWLLSSLVSGGQRMMRLKKLEPGI